MKKLNYLLLGLAGLTLASCSNDDLQAPADGSYQLTVNLPKDIATRAIGDEITANQVLNYTIFTENGDYVDSKTDVSFNGGTSMTLNLPLLKGNSYKIAFFAQSENSSDVYLYDYESSVVTVQYANMTYGNDVDADAYDCFSGTYAIKNVSTGLSDNITLKRPVAQINWGTDDLTAGAVTSAFGTEYSNLRTSLSLNTYTTLNVIDGSYGDTDDITFPATALPVTEESFPAGSGYSYLAMQYVLAEAETAQPVDLELNVTSSETSSSVTPIKIEVGNAPIQANYRTNIYGSLLTDQANLTVSLSADWGGETNLVWDGQTVTIPTIENNTITTKDPAVIAGIASMVKGGDDLKGVTITLTDNIDMGGYSFPGIGTATRSSASTGSDTKPFRGTFDGGGKTISGLNITYNGSDGNAVAAFIPNLDGTGEVKNVTFDNVTINGGAAEQAGIVGLVTNGATVSGVTVTSGSITAAEGAGGIVGRVLKNGTIEDCENHANITVSKYNSGGIAGAAYYSETDGCKINITNCNNYGNITASTGTLGGIVGTSAANIINCNNHGSVGEATKTAPAGGIVGYQNSCGSIEGCTNYGTVQGTAEVAGIVAFIGAVTYDYVAPIYLTGNTHKGNLIGSGTVGGILGINRNGCYLQDNTNDASSMSGSTVAGIVGNAGKYGTTADGYVWLVLNSEGTNSNVNNTLSENMQGTKVQPIFTGTLYIGEELQTN